MNILFFTAWLWLWGTERAAVDIAIHFKKNYNRKVCFLSFSGWERQKELDQLWISVSFCNYSNQNIILHNLIKKNKISVLYVWMVWRESIDVKWLENILKINEIIFSWWYSKIPNNNICISNALRHKIELIYPGSKTEMVYFPFNNKRRDKAKSVCQNLNLRKKYQIPDDLFIIWRIARPELTKRWLNFIMNIVYILKGDKKIWLVLLWLPRLYKLFLWPFQKRIWYFPTSWDDNKLAQIYSILDCYYHTAEVGETFGMVLAEAMYFGLPVISHSTHFQKDIYIDNSIDNSQIEIIENWVNWYISNDKNLIYEWIRKLKNDKEYYYMIASNNKKKVLREYNINKICDKLYYIITEHNYKDNINSKILYEKALYNINDENRYKYNEPYIFVIIKKAYSIIRYVLRKIWIDLEKFRITNDFI